MHKIAVNSPILASEDLFIVSWLKWKNGLPWQKRNMSFIHMLLQPKFVSF